MDAAPNTEIVLMFKNDPRSYYFATEAQDGNLTF